MNRMSREVRHQANVLAIGRVQRVVGRGDDVRIDHEATVLERARMLAEELRSHQATEDGLAALDRLLRAAEDPQAGHRAEVVGFLLAVWGHRPLNLRCLRGPAHPLVDDMLAVLDAYRWGRLNLVEQVTGGARRFSRAIEATAEHAA